MTFFKLTKCQMSCYIKWKLVSMIFTVLCLHVPSSRCAPVLFLSFSFSLFLSLNICRWCLWKCWISSVHDRLAGILCLASDLHCSSDVHNKLPLGISMIMQWQRSTGITTSFNHAAFCVCAYVCAVTYLLITVQCLSFLEKQQGLWDPIIWL